MKSGSFYKDQGVEPNSFSKELEGLKPCKSTGLDGIPPRFLKDGAVVLKALILHLVNFPDELKMAKITPLFKKGSKLEVSNYRPVSVLSTVSKILERVACIQVEKYLKDNSILYDFQSGKTSQPVPVLYT